MDHVTSATDPAVVRDLRRLQRMALWCGWGALAITLTALLGWCIGVRALAGPPSLPQMTPAAAVMGICCACGVLAEAGVARLQRVSRYLLGLAMAVAVGILLGYALGLDAGVARRSAELFPGDEDVARPSPQAAWVLLLGAATILLLRHRTGRRARLGAFFTFLSAALVNGALIGYLLGTHELYSSADTNAIAPAGVPTMSLVTIACAALRPTHLPGRWFAERGAGDLTARRILPVGIVGPTAIAAFVQLGVRAGWWSSVMAISLLALCGVVTVLALLTWGVAMVRDYEAEEEALERENTAHRARFELLTRRAPVAIFEADPDGNCLFVNACWEDITGICADDAVGAGWHRALHPDDRDRVNRMWVQAVRDGMDFRTEYRLVDPQGEVRWLDGHVSTIKDGSGAVTGMLGTSLDITDRREAEERFRMAFDNAPIGVALVSLDGGFLKVNRALCDMTGYAEGELLARTFMQITHPDDLGADMDLVRDALEGRRRKYELEKRYLRSDGETIWTLLSVSLVRDLDGAPLYFVSQIQDISERKRQEHELRYMSEHDVLTGLANRRQLGVELVRRVAERRRHGHDFSLVLLDLDHFKYVNDSLGHHVGDRMLRAVADALRARLRETDLIARLGGDEFACVLGQTTAEEAEAVAADLVACVRDLRIRVADRELRVTASAGIVLGADGHAHSGPGALLAAADLAMYQAKDAGRDRVSVHSPEDGAVDQASDRLNWSHRIRRALDEDRFVLHYQPIVDLHDPSVLRYEALIRLDDGHDDALAMPGTFLFIAERYGLLPAIDRWVARRVITTLAAGQLPAGAQIALNVSARSLADGELLDLVERLLEDYDVGAQQLCFELTETVAISKLDEARRFGERLRELGCGFALDDFGTGFGSFTHIKHLPYDTIKIDGDFVRGVTGSRQDRAVVEAMVHVAQATGKRTVAEFVGDAETLELLVALGVDMAQGYHLGRPVPAAELLRQAIDH